jgi:CBS domain-containing protein
MNGKRRFEMQWRSSLGRRSQSLAEAAQLMKSEDVGSLPVVDDGRLVAMLTDRDIVVRAVAEGVDANATVVGDVASREPVSVGAGPGRSARPDRTPPGALPAGGRPGWSGRDRRAGRRCPAGEVEASGRGAGGDLEADRGRIVSPDAIRGVVEPPPTRPDPQPEPPPEPIPEPRPEPEPTEPEPPEERRC